MKVTLQYFMPNFTVLDDVECLNVKKKSSQPNHGGLALGGQGEGRKIPKRYKTR